MRTLGFWLTRLGLVIGSLLIVASLQEPLVEHQGEESLRLTAMGGLFGLGFLAWLLLPVLLATAFVYAVVLLPSPRPARRARWASAGYLLSIASALGMVVLTSLLFHQFRHGPGLDESTRVSAALPISLVGLAFGAASLYWLARARD